MKSGLLAAGAMLALGTTASAQTPGAPCPTAILPPRSGQTAPPAILIATSIKPSDTTTSTVIQPDPADQIRCGRIPLTSIRDVRFAHVRVGGGNSRDLRLDILAPAARGRYPLVVYITGGGFVSAHKENALNLRSFVAEHGFVVASIEYRTAPEGTTYRDGVVDVKSAIRFLRAHAGDYGIDPHKFALWGESAGGYLAAMAGLTNGLKQFDQGDNLGQSSAVQAVVDKFGLVDARTVAADFNPEMAAMTAPGTSFASYLTADSEVIPATIPI